MGHREKLINGDEYDYLRRGARNSRLHKAGQIKKIKRAFWKRQRRNEKEVLQETR